MLINNVNQILANNKAQITIIKHSPIPKHSIQTKTTTQNKTKTRNQTETKTNPKKQASEANCNYRQTRIPTQTHNPNLTTKNKTTNN